VQAFREERLHNDLEAVLAHEHEWPSPARLTDLGGDAMYRRVLYLGGGREWARRLGMPYAVNWRASRWTETDIRRELHVFTAGRSTRPTRREFEAAGKGGMLHAIRRLGGADQWAVDLGLDGPAKSPPATSVTSTTTR
jgi:hypothetical protein